MGFYGDGTAGGTVSTPVISPAGTDSSSLIKVTITTDTDGAVIYYTVDGSEPSASNGEVYADGIDVYYNLTVKAVAVKEGYENSKVVTENYTIASANIGAPVDTYPNWQERTMLTHTNALRMAPAQYKSDYFGWDDSVAALSIYGPRQPLYWHYELSQAARFHSDDLFTYNYNNPVPGFYEHDSTDGTPMLTRIQTFYSAVSFKGENMAKSPGILATLRLWMDDISLPDPASFEQSTGHRYYVMNTDANIVGVGFSGSGTLSYWTMDFASNTPDSYPLIPSASHDFLETGKITFMLNYYDADSKAPLKTALFLDGVKYDMPLDIGESWMGTYSVSAEKVAACRSYYFLIVDSNGKVWRYPGPGSFSTYGEGSCTGNYSN